MIMLRFKHLYLMLLALVAFQEAIAASACLMTLPSTSVGLVNAIGRGQIEQLVACGFQVNQPIYLNKEPLTALELAAGLDDPKLVEQLIAFGANPNVSSPDSASIVPLEIALSTRKYRAARMLLIHGARANYQLVLSGRTALMAMVFDDRPVSERADMLELLLSTGAEINAVDIKGNTVLHWAARRQDVAYVEMLLNAGADKCIVNAKGQRAVDVAPVDALVLRRQLFAECSSTPKMNSR